MSRSIRSPRTQRKARPRKCATLTPSEINLLLESSVAFVRSHALYAMAIAAGLAASHLHALDIGDVTPDGKNVKELVVAHRLARRNKRAPSFTLNPAVRQVVTRYLGWRRARCAHFKTKLQTYLDGDGIERCHACHDVADPLQAPLFVGLRSTRFSSRRMRDEFGRWRQELGLNPKLRFDSMRATFRDSLLLRDGSQLGVLIRDDES